MRIDIRDSKYSIIYNEKTGTVEDVLWCNESAEELKNLNVVADTESLGIILYKNLQRIQSVLLGFVRMQTIYYTGNIQHLRIVDRTLYNNAILFLRIKLIAGIVNTLGFSSQRAKH